MPFRDGTYDCTYTEAVPGFQAAASAQQMLSEAYRVLKPGGLLVANKAIWITGLQADVAARINRPEVADCGLGEASEQAWSVNDWLRLMCEGGFEVISSAGLDHMKPHPVEQHRSFAARCALPASALLTRLYPLKGYLHAGLWAQKGRYRRLLHEHTHDDAYIEGRLFILRTFAYERRGVATPRPYQARHLPRERKS